MREVLYDFEEFRKRAKKPIHYDWSTVPIGDFLTRLTFTLTSAGRGCPLVFEHREVVNGLKLWGGEGSIYERINSYIDERVRELIEEFAKPVGATPGRWEG